MSITPRVGVYVCHCGVNISATVDIAALTRYATHLPGVVVARDYTYMCSDPGQALIKNDIIDLNLNRVVVASCSPRMHEPTFRAAVAEAGLNPYCFEMANIREQCSWVHPNQPSTTYKAMELVASAVAKARQLNALEVRQVSVTPAALVIGGGIAGIQAALDIADAGFPVTLVEQAEQIGGQAARLHRTFPTLEDIGSMIAPLIQRVREHPRIQVLTSTQVVEVGGYVGNFQVKLRQGAQETTVLAGTIIVATGFDVFDPHRRPELGYGEYPEVITTVEFDRLAAGDLRVNGHPPRDVVFIHCVGSRDQKAGNAYCSRVCCMVAARQAHLVRQRYPDSQVTVFYMDMRAFGKGFEEYYDQLREDGVLYRRGNPAEIIRRGDRVVVRAEDTLLGEAVEVEADMVVLAVGMTPRANSNEIAALLKLSRSSDGFLMEAHPKLRPVDTAMAGVYLAGCCQGPKDIGDTISQARAAASAAMIPLMRRHVQVDASTSFILEELCAGCGQCAAVCTFGALSLHPVRGVMTANPVLCQGCGACATACPSGAINVHHFTFNQFIDQIDALTNWQIEPASLLNPQVVDP